MAPHLGHVGDAGVGQLVLEHGRAHDGAVAGHLVGPGAQRRHPQDDGVVAVVDGADVQGGLLAGAAGIVAGPLPERPFHRALVLRQEAFQHDLGVGGDGQARHLAAHHLDGRAAQPAHHVELAHAVRKLRAPHEERHGVAAHHQGHRHGLALVEVLLPVHVGVLAGHEQQAHRLRVLHHGPVGADVDPALVRVDGDAEAAGADVAPAVVGVPLGGGELHDVDVVAGEDVLEHGPVVHHHVGQPPLHLDVMLEERLAQLLLGEVLREPQRHVAALAGERVDQDAEPLGAAGDLVEQHRGPVVFPDHRVRGQPDVLFPARTGNGAQLAQGVGPGDPFTEVVVREPGFDVSGCVHASRLSDRGGACQWYELTPMSRQRTSLFSGSAAKVPSGGAD